MEDVEKRALLKLSFKPILSKRYEDDILTIVLTDEGIHAPGPSGLARPPTTTSPQSSVAAQVHPSVQREEEDEDEEQKWEDASKEGPHHSDDARGRYRFRGRRPTNYRDTRPVSPERGIFRPPPRSHLGETHANVACQCVGSATRCGHQLRVKPKVHEDGLRYNV